MRENENPSILAAAASAHTDVSLREHVDAIIAELRAVIVTEGTTHSQRVRAEVSAIMALLEERDRRYEERFVASATAVSAALVSQEKLVAAAFLASEKAIVKAEDAQREYNVRSNEFRGQLDDQAKTLLPRTESASELKGIEARIEAGTKDREKKYDETVAALALLREAKAGRESVEALARDVTALRDAQHAAQGRQQVADPMMTELVAEMRALTAQRAADAGKAAVVDPTLATLIAEVHRNSATLATGAGKDAGFSASWAILLGAAGFLATTLTIGGMIYAGTHTITQQQGPTAVQPPAVIYVPASPMLPTSPQSPPQPPQTR
jgi:hypothetical protein